MPGPLIRRKTDPNKKGRGAGVYYHRGKGVYSKYSKDRDRKKHSKTLVKKGRYRHTGELSKRTWI